MAVNEWEQAEPGVTRKIHPPGEQLMMMEVAFEAGAEGSTHSYPHEQLTYCLEGSLMFHVDGQDITIQAGESLRIPSNAVHGVKALMNSKLLDVFTPLREDLLKRGE